MREEIHLHDVVALLEDVPTRHFETGQPLRLRRGQPGAIVMIYDGTVFDVAFAGRDGRTLAMLPLPPHKLMVLHASAELAAA